MQVKCFIVRLILTLILLPPAIRAYSQKTGEEGGIVLHSFMVGAGSANLLDTYLSPYNYKGIDIRLVRETFRMTSLADSNIAVQTFLNADFAFLRNRAHTADEYSGGARYSVNWMYRFKVCPSLMLYAGGGLTGYGGGTWNTRNSNNPGQARLELMADATAEAVYNLKIRSKTYQMRYQLALPMLGAAFSPHYGQSYYEMSLGHYDHNVCFAYFGNMPSLRQVFSVNIPVAGVNLRLGYVGDISQSKLNGLRYHNYTHTLMVGVAKYFYRVKKQKTEQLFF